MPAIMKLKGLCKKFQTWFYTTMVSSILQAIGIFSTAWLKLDVCNYTGLLYAFSLCKCDFAVNATGSLIFNRIHSSFASNRTIAISCLEEIVYRTETCDTCRQLDKSMDTTFALLFISFACYGFYFFCGFYQLRSNKDCDSRETLKKSSWMYILTSVYFLGCVSNVSVCGLVLGHATSNTSLKLGFSFYLCFTTGCCSAIGVVIFWIVVWWEKIQQKCKQASCKMQIQMNCLRHMADSDIEDSRNSHEFPSNDLECIDSNIIELNILGDINPARVRIREVSDTSAENNGTTNMTFRGAQVPVVIYENVTFT